MKSVKKSQRAFRVGALAAGALLTSSLAAGAAPIVVVNPSFEVDGFRSPTDAITGWTGGAYIETGNFGGSPIDPALGGDGIYYATLLNGSGSLSQTTGQAVALGDVITLTVSVGDRGYYTQDNTPADYAGLVALTLDGTPVATNLEANTGDPVEGSFGNATVFYTATATDVGKFLGVTLSPNPGSRSDYDHVRLDVTAAVPEPTTIVSLLGGVALLGTLRRRTRLS